MAKIFGKCLGKIVLMTAAALWAGCSDSEKADDTTKQGDSVLVQLQNVKKRVDEKPEVKDTSILNEASVTLYGCNGDCRGDSFFLVKKPFDGKDKEQTFENVEMTHDGAVHSQTARCYVKMLKAEDVVVEKNASIDVDAVIRIVNQRTPGLGHVCTKILKEPKSRTKRTKLFTAKMVLKLKINSDGSVESAESESTSIRQGFFSKISDEVVKKVSVWEFPKTQNGGAVTISLSFYEDNPSSL